MNRKLDPKTNVPTIATLTVAFLTKLLDWTTAVLPDTIPDGVVESGYGLAVALGALAVGKLAQHFTWAQDSVDRIMDAEHVIRAAERDDQ